MQQGYISEILCKDALLQLNESLKGEITEHSGEYMLKFDNKIGNGIIRCMNFDWGVTLVNYDVTFNEEFSIVSKVGDINPLEFFFISMGSLTYCCDKEGRKLNIGSLQNIIISNEKFSNRTLIFPKGINVKVNFIKIIKENYLQKMNNNLDLLDSELLPIIQEEDSFVYYHIGNHSFKIEEEIQKLIANSEEGIVKSLSMEGQLNLILAMQLMEHSNYVNKIALPENLTLKELKKIYALTDYIKENISNGLSVNKLTEESGLNAKKLQEGFQLLHSQSVNVYIRGLKLKIASEQLKNTDLSISEIVYNIGFSSRSYFSKIFFEQYGILPTSFRKNSKVAIK